jgi:hypothetical protein
MKKGILILVLMLAAAVQVSTAQETQVTLKEVVVTATKTEKDLKDVTQPVTVITADEIRKSGATDVAAAIQNAAGVHIADYGTPGSVASASIRGAQSAQILVLVNGIRLNSSRDGGFDLSFIPVSKKTSTGSRSCADGLGAVRSGCRWRRDQYYHQESGDGPEHPQGSLGSHGYDNMYLATPDARALLVYCFRVPRNVRRLP